jgi:PPP family 3-phenylpropionic acid transporter
MKKSFGFLEGGRAAGRRAKMLNRVMAASRFGFSTRLAAFYAAICMLIGVQLPFLPVWLKAKGLDAATIGLVLAIPMVVRVVAIPVVAREADRRDALRVSVIVASFLTVAGYTVMGFASGAIAIAATFALASIFFTPVMPLTETYALRGLSERGRAYGPVRVWGSVAFIVGTFATGFAADMIAARHLIWLVVAVSILCVAAAVMLAPLATGEGAPVQTSAPRKKLLRDPVFIAVLAAASLIQASHAVFYGFSVLSWRSAGLDGTAIAALWALGVIAEIVLFAVSGRLPPFFQPAVLLLIGACGATVRWIAMAFDPPAVALPFLQVLHALSFGTTHLGALNFLTRTVPAGQAATAQGHLAIALGLVMAAAMGLSGVLYEAYGNLAYLAMALTAVAGGYCAGVAHRAIRVSAV